MDRRAIGRKINELRVNKGLTQAQLAENLDISYKAISKWEVGGVVPDVEMLIKVADFFDISLEELLLINKDKSKNEKALIKKEKEATKRTTKSKKSNNKAKLVNNDNVIEKSDKEIKKENKTKPIDSNESIQSKQLTNTILIGVSLAMGICVLTLSILNEISNNSAILMLSLGLISLNIYLLSKNKF